MPARLREAEVDRKVLCAACGEHNAGGAAVVVGSRCPLTDRRGDVARREGAAVDRDGVAADAQAAEQVCAAGICCGRSRRCAGEIHRDAPDAEFAGILNAVAVDVIPNEVADLAGGRRVRVGDGQDRALIVEEVGAGDRLSVVNRRSEESLVERCDRAHCRGGKRPVGIGHGPFGNSHCVRFDGNYGIDGVDQRALAILDRKASRQQIRLCGTRRLGGRIREVERLLGRARVGSFANPVLAFEGKAGGRRRANGDVQRRPLGCGNVGGWRCSGSVTTRSENESGCGDDRRIRCANRGHLQGSL